MLPQIDLLTYPEHTRKSAPWHKGEGNGGCWLCGHAHIGKAPKMITVEAGTFTCVDPALATEETLGSSIYLQPIGNTCLKNHPELKPYVYEAPDDQRTQDRHPDLLLPLPGRDHRAGGPHLG